MKLFEKPEIEFVEFIAEEIIVTSGCTIVCTSTCWYAPCPRISHDDSY